MKFNTKYDLVLTVTFINDQFINKFLDSIFLNKNLNTLVIIVKQIDIALNLNDFGNNFTFIEINTNKCSSSSARNIAIDYLFVYNINFKHIMFPDDDSMFSELFFTNYLKTIEEEKDYIIEVFFENTGKLYKNNNFKNYQNLNTTHFMSVLCVNMLICYSTFFKNKYFDNRLGAGAQFGGGEDLDYYLRACKINNEKFNYISGIHCFHPAPNTRYSSLSFNQLIKRFNNYGKGTIFALYKNKLYFNAILIIFRALGGFIYSLLTFKIKLSIAYLASFYTRLFTLIKCFIFY